MSTAENKDAKLELLYTLFCDDVRLEAGNKLSFRGFQNIMVQQMPVSLIKFAVVNHWRGEGASVGGEDPDAGSTASGRRFAANEF